MSKLKTALGLGGAVGSLALAPFTGGYSLAGLLPALSVAKSGGVDEPQYEGDLETYRLEKAYAPYTGREISRMKRPEEPDTWGDAIGSLGYGLLFAGMNPGGISTLGSGIGSLGKAIGQGAKPAGNYLWNAMSNLGTNIESGVRGLGKGVGGTWDSMINIGRDPMEGVNWTPSPKARFIR